MNSTTGRFWGALAVLWAFAHLPAQDLSAQYQRVQDAYSERKADIEQRFESASRELLNKFILSLVRVEQDYKDEGNLDGVVVSRALREQTLTTSEYPEIEDGQPEKIRGMLQDLHAKREEARTAHQKELDALNRVLIDALEPYQVEFTKRGELDTAIQILEIRKELQAALGVGGSPTAHASPTSGPAVASTNPHAYGFCLEPALYAEIQDVTAREPAIPFELEAHGVAKVGEQGYHLNRGMMTIPAQATAALLERVKKNQMLTVEFALRPTVVRTDPLLPAPVLVYGMSPGNANLAVTQEGRNLFLYLRTSTVESGGAPHKIDLGVVDTGRAQHVMVTYRNGELTVYRDGSETLKRRDINGLLNNWEAYPVMMGGLQTREGTPPEFEAWRGVIFQFYMKASLETARDASQNYNRFGTAISR